MKITFDRHVDFIDSTAEAEKPRQWRLRHIRRIPIVRALARRFAPSSPIIQWLSFQAHPP
jgi:hypothetical protein